MMLTSNRMDWNESSASQKFLGQEPSSSLSGNVFSPAFCAPNIFKHLLCHLHERWWNLAAITHDLWHWEYRGMLIFMLRFLQSLFECVRRQSRHSYDVKMIPKQRLETHQPCRFVMATGAFDVDAQRGCFCLARSLATCRSGKFLPG